MRIEAEANKLWRACSLLMVPGDLHDEARLHIAPS